MIGRAGSSGEFLGQMLMRGFELGQWQADPCLAIRAGAAVRLRPTLRRIPRLYLANDLATGAARIQDLTEKSPERQLQRVKAFATVEAANARSQKIRGQPRAENLAQPAQAGLAHPMGLRAQRIKLGTPLPAAKLVENTGKKGGPLHHAPA